MVLVTSVPLDCVVGCADDDEVEEEEEEADFPDFLLFFGGGEREAKERGEEDKVDVEDDEDMGDEDEICSISSSLFLVKPGLSLQEYCASFNIAVAGGMVNPPSPGVVFLSAASNCIKAFGPSISESRSISGEKSRFCSGSGAEEAGMVIGSGIGDGDDEGEDSEATLLLLSEGEEADIVVIIAIIVVSSLPSLLLMAVAVVVAVLFASKEFSKSSKKLNPLLPSSSSASLPFAKSDIMPVFPPPFDDGEEEDENTGSKRSVDPDEDRK